MPRFSSPLVALPSLAEASEGTRASIRGRQLLAVDQLIAPMMVANVVVSAGLTALLYEEYGRILLPWLVVVSLASSWRFAEAIRATKQGPQSRPLSDMRRLIRQACLMSLAFNGVPAWLLTQTSGLACTIVVCQLTGLLWAGSLILTTAVPAAVCYLVLTTALIGGCFIVAGLDLEHLYLVALFIAGAGTALRSVLQQNYVFVSDQIREVALQQKSEVIGVLLRDYEEQTSDWLWETDARLLIRDASERFVQVSRRTAGELAAMTLDGLLATGTSSDQGNAVEQLRSYIAERRSFRDLSIPVELLGEVRWWSLSGRPQLDESGSFSGYRGVGTDVTKTKRAEAHIAHLAHHDALTNLPNRAFFAASLEHILDGSEKPSIAILSVDLDGFKSVNDMHGHPVGDAVLIKVAERLTSIVKLSDMVARFGGDEYVILLRNFVSVKAVELLCQKIIDRLTVDFQVEEIVVSVGVSIGVAFSETDGRTPAAILKNADSALYRAKQAGRGTFRFFSLEADRRIQDRQELLHDLRAALARDEFKLFFQPYVCASGEDITGCEALLRWRHPKRGLISPLTFIPLAEESGLISAIGTWVLEQACLEAVRWPAPRRVSVNISPVQFRNRALPDIILAALTRSGLASARLEIEVTEAVLIEDVEGALSILRQIRSRGVRIALDDFGTGYSSLSYLRRFPFDKLKIDRSFVQELETRHDSQVIVRAIRDIAKGLGMTITAEGVETIEQADRLRQVGCEELQGYLFSEPGLPEHLGLRLAGPATRGVGQSDGGIVAA